MAFPVFIGVMMAFAEVLICCMLLGTQRVLSNIFFVFLLLVANVWLVQLGFYLQGKHMRKKNPQLGRLYLFDGKMLRSRHVQIISVNGEAPVHGWAANIDYVFLPPGHNTLVVNFTGQGGLGTEYGTRNMVVPLYVQEGAEYLITPLVGKDRSLDYQVKQITAKRHYRSYRIKLLSILALVLAVGLMVVNSEVIVPRRQAQRAQAQQERQQQIKEAEAAERQKIVDEAVERGAIGRVSRSFVTNPTSSFILDGELYFSAGSKGREVLYRYRMGEDRTQVVELGESVPPGGPYNVYQHQVHALLDGEDGAQSIVILNGNFEIGDTLVELPALEGKRCVDFWLMDGFAYCLFQKVSGGIVLSDYMLLEINLATGETTRSVDCGNRAAHLVYDQGYLYSYQHGERFSIGELKALTPDQRYYSKYAVQDGYVYGYISNYGPRRAPWDAPGDFIAFGPMSGEHSVAYLWEDDDYFYLRDRERATGQDSLVRMSRGNPEDKQTLYQGKDFDQYYVLEDSCLIQPSTGAEEPVFVLYHNGKVTEYPWGDFLYSHTDSTP